MAARKLVFVHGWSVRNTDTYGGLPDRLRSEAKRDPSLDLDVREIWLGQYISFHNEVRIPDIARALDAALTRELGAGLAKGERFACITHSTGGPVVREWLHRFHLRGRRRCALAQLIMLAPANFGSALAQLGQSRLARLRTMFEGVEPGFGVLDWLELGSPENLALNMEWLVGAAKLKRAGVLPFVLTGTSIDRQLYDHVNSYTGEMGSDGVVRAAAANLNFTQLTLTQEPPRADPKARPVGRAEAATLGAVAPKLVAGKPKRVTGTPFAIVEGRAHSGDEIGVMRSVRDDGKPHPTVAVILDCLRVQDGRAYATAAKSFAARSAEVMARQQLETEDIPGPFDRHYIHDACAMVVFRVRDDQGQAIKDFELMFTAGDDDPDALPPGFFIDRQRNQRDPGAITYYLNHAKLVGAPAVKQGSEVLRAAQPGTKTLGLRVTPYPQDGFVHFLPCVLPPGAALLAAIRPYETTVVDIVLRRVVREGVFRLTKEARPADFTKAPPGGPIEG
jgi:hypothetical protein